MRTNRMHEMRRKRRKKYSDTQGAPDPGMQVTDQSKVMPENQVSGMIDAVLAGENANQLLTNTIAEIREHAGPFPIGSKVRVNQPWTGMDIAGKPANVTRGEAVTVLMTNLGEQGYDKMVLLPDGVTRVVIPLRFLGEDHSDGGFDDAGASTDPHKGPSGYQVPSATGGLGGVIVGKLQGDAPKPTDIAQQKGSSVPLTIPANPQGSSLPKEDPAAQVLGSMVPISHPSVPVETVMQQFEDVLDEAADAGMYHRINELARAVFFIDDPHLYAVVSEALRSKREIRLSDLESLFEDDAAPDDDDEFMKQLGKSDRDDFGDMTPAERKRFRKKYAYRKKYSKKFGEAEGDNEAEFVKQLDKKERDEYEDLPPAERKKYRRKYRQKFGEQDDSGDEEKFVQQLDKKERDEYEAMPPAERKKFRRSYRRKYGEGTENNVFRVVTEIMQRNRGKGRR